MEDLQEDLLKLSQGRRLQITLGGQGYSTFSYRAVILDAEELADPFTYHCGVFIVPKVCFSRGVVYIFVDCIVVLFLNVHVYYRGRDTGLLTDRRSFDYFLGYFFAFNFIYLLF